DRPRRRDHLRRNGDSRTARPGADAAARARQLVDACVDALPALHPAPRAAAGGRDGRGVTGAGQGSAASPAPPARQGATNDANTSVGFEAEIVCVKNGTNVVPTCANPT